MVKLKTIFMLKHPLMKLSAFPEKSISNFKVGELTGWLSFCSAWDMLFPPNAFLVLKPFVFTVRLKWVAELFGEETIDEMLTKPLRINDISSALNIFHSGCFSLSWGSFLFWHGSVSLATWGRSSSLTLNSSRSSAIQFKLIYSSIPDREMIKTNE